MAIRYGFYKTDIGLIKIGYDSQVDIIDIVGHIDEKDEKSIISDKAYLQLSEYLSGKRRDFDFDFRMSGTPFQLKVWQALCDIPYGKTKSYKQIAADIGHPKACRAVGMANNRNKLLIVVPCHRVIGSSGKLVGYAGTGGLALKERLLSVEKVT